ncbi:MAG TPA: kynureninase [Streptosporangiaceae bacterium]|jgi:kynureninase|nr:kynureninase [Streptosporangiaceae bacterium]
MTFSADRSYAESLDAADELAGFRDRFVRADHDVVYLDGNSLGPLPVRTQARIAEVVDQEWGIGLVRSWDKWIQLPRQAGDMVGEHLVGAAPGQVLVCDSVTVNLYKLASAALDYQAGRDVIITDDDNFPTDRYVLQGIAAQRGAELRMIHTDMDQGVSAEALAEALDERTALVSLSHVAYRSGALADMRGLTERIHAVGALALWDLCHSVGAVPVELDASGADLAIGCTYKYVNAGPGAPAFLYVRDGLQDQLRQPIWGWFGQRDQFAMGPGYNPAPGIDAYLTGTPQIVGTVGVEEGARLLGEAGMTRLRAKGTELTRYLIALADELLAPLGFAIASPRDDARRGAHVTLRHDDAWQISQALIRENVIGDYRTPDRIRLGPAPITSRFVDVWTAIDTLRQIAADKSYADIPSEQARVT